MRIQATSVRKLARKTKWSLQFYTLVGSNIWPDWPPVGAVQQNSVQSAPVFQPGPKDDHEGVPEGPVVENQRDVISG